MTWKWPIQNLVTVPFLRIEMSKPINESVNTTETNEETQSLTGHEPSCVDIAAIRLSSPVASEGVLRQIKAAFDPITKQLKRCCD